jgi:hypothetical protein
MTWIVVATLGAASRPTAVPRAPASAHRLDPEGGEAAGSVDPPEQVPRRDRPAQADLLMLMPIDSGEMAQLRRTRRVSGLEIQSCPTVVGRHLLLFMVLSR